MKRIVILLTLFIVLIPGILTAAEIVHEVTINRIVGQDDFSWAPGENKYCRNVAVSEDGSKVVFRARLGQYPSTPYIGYDSHVYTADIDGSNWLEFTDAITAAGADAKMITYLEVNRDASRVFFIENAQNKIYYCDLSGTPACAEAATIQYDWYGSNQDGSRVFFQNGLPWDTYRGFWYSDGPGGTPVQFLDVDVLCGNEDNCGNPNLLSLLAVGADTETVLFAWNDPDHNRGMYAMTVGGTPVRVPNEEPLYFWPNGFDRARGLVTDDGTRALFYYQYEGQPWMLDMVDLATGNKTNLAQQNNAAYGSPFIPIRMAGTGAHVLVNSDIFRASKIDTATLSKIDTMSYHVDVWKNLWYDTVSNLTGDGRYYFFSNTDTPFRLFRVDTAPADFSSGPHITAINFSPDSLALDNPGQLVKLTAAVSHAQGLDQIQYVGYRTLTDGQETPAWQNWQPLKSWGGDDQKLFDDGSNGDETANDGIFTRQILINTESNYWAEKTPPYEVGVRVVARDADKNHVLADTMITVYEVTPPVPRAGSNPGVYLLLDTD